MIFAKARMPTPDEICWKFLINCKREFTNQVNQMLNKIKISNDFVIITECLDNFKFSMSYYRVLKTAGQTICECTKYTKCYLPEFVSILDKLYAIYVKMFKRISSLGRLSHNQYNKLIRLSEMNNRSIEYLHNLSGRPSALLVTELIRMYELENPKPLGMVNRIMKWLNHE